MCTNVHQTKNNFVEEKATYKISPTKLLLCEIHCIHISLTKYYLALKDKCTQL